MTDKKTARVGLHVTVIGQTLVLNTGCQFVWEMLLANEAELRRTTRQEQLVGLYVANYWEENCHKLLIFL